MTLPEKSYYISICQCIILNYMQSSILDEKPLKPIELLFFLHQKSSIVSFQIKKIEKLQTLYKMHNLDSQKIFTFGDDT